MCDIVELIWTVEEHFGIAISDERAERICTVGDLYLYLLGQTRRQALTPCPTSQAFYHLRRTLTRELGVDRKRVRPATRLHDLFPAATRNATWPRLAAVLGLPDLPDLPPRHGPSARAFKFTLAGVTLAWWLVYPILLLLPDENLPISFALLVSFLLAVLVCEFFGIFWLAAFFDHFERIRIPRIRHLVIRLVVRQPNRSPGGDATEPTPQTVWTDLVALLATQSGASAEKIRPEHRFCDLGGC